MQVTNAALDRLARISHLAGEAIMPHYARPDAGALKADGSPITEADRASHRVIAAELARWDPSIPVVSEEGRIAPYDERQGWTRFWLVDPLDGTKEFIK